MKFAHAVLIAALAAPAFAAFAQDRDQTRDETQTQLRDQDIYGYQMMTPQERDQFRARMQAPQTQEERERIRAEHHALMQERAKERGLSMPEQPPMQGGAGGGMGPGYGGGRAR
ncbi:MAG TPA: hypothetical protein VFC18_01305 [Burkholderiales bacterium]|nr:hypothetical protein [Burkholderiales bacterium]